MVIDDKHIPMFIVYSRNYENFDDGSDLMLKMKEVLKKEYSGDCIVNCCQVGSTIMAEVAYDEYLEHIYDLHVPKDISIGHGSGSIKYNKNNFSMVCGYDFHINELCNHFRYINIIGGCYAEDKTKMFKELGKFDVRCCAVIWDEDRYSLIAGSTDTPYSICSHLYYGYTAQDNAMVFSNFLGPLREFCGEVFELKNAYMVDGKFYTLDGKRVGIETVSEKINFEEYLMELEENSIEIGEDLMKLKEDLASIDMDGQIFIGYKRNSSDREGIPNVKDKIENVLKRKCESGYTVKSSRIGNIVMAEISPDDFDDIYIYYDLNTELTMVNSHNNYRIKYAIGSWYANYGNEVFRKLDIPFCAFSLLRESLIVGVTDASDEYSHLYYGYIGKYNDMIFSNDAEILREFCSEIFEMKKSYMVSSELFRKNESYIGNEEFYTLDGKKVDREAVSEKIEFTKDVEDEIAELTNSTENNGTEKSMKLTRSRKKPETNK